MINEIKTIFYDETILNDDITKIKETIGNDTFVFIDTEVRNIQKSLDDNGYIINKCGTLCFVGICTKLLLFERIKNIKINNIFIKYENTKDEDFYMLKAIFDNKNIFILRKNTSLINTINYDYGHYRKTVQSILSKNPDQNVVWIDDEFVDVPSSGIQYKSLIYHINHNYLQTLQNILSYSRIDIVIINNRMMKYINQCKMIEDICRECEIECYILTQKPRKNEECDISKKNNNHFSEQMIINYKNFILIENQLSDTMRENNSGIPIIMGNVKIRRKYPSHLFIMNNIWDFLDVSSLIRDSLALNIKNYSFRSIKYLDEDQLQLIDFQNLNNFIFIEKVKNGLDTSKFDTISAIYDFDNKFDFINIKESNNEEAQRQIDIIEKTLNK